MKTQEQTGTKERITICLEEKQVAVVDKVCQAMPCSRSWLIAQLIESADLTALIKGYEGGPS
jgi:hypothetical protein